MSLVISKTFRFEASHVLPKHEGKCSRLHGHSWELQVAIEGIVNPNTGFILDYGILKELVQTSIIDHVDHQHLGVGDLTTTQPRIHDYPVADIIPSGFYPSSENLVVLFGQIIRQRIKELPRYSAVPGITLSWVSLKETCTSEATWYPE